MDDDLYRDEILDYSESKAHRGRLEDPDYQADLDNPLCGDCIHIELAVDDDGRIDRVRFEGRGCAISQASAAMLAEHLEGKSECAAREMTADDMMSVLGIQLTPARRKCGLLAWKAVNKALDSAGPEANVGGRSRRP